MTEFDKWWKREAMEDRIHAGYEAWFEVNDGCMDYNDITSFQKEMAEIAWQAARRWIPVSEDMPKNGVPVLAYGYNEYGKLRRIRADYIRPYTVEFTGNDEGDVNFADYDEEKNIYYIPEGWYEHNEHEETHWMIEFPILGWQPLPNPPEAE